MDQLRAKIAGEIALSENPGDAMKKWREGFNISQTELEKHLKITPSTVSDYEGNRRKSPGIVVIKRFVDAIINIDTGRGGELVKRFNEAEAPQSFFDAVNFLKPMSGEDSPRLHKERACAGEERLPTASLYGATIIDSIKVILELPYESF